jgi:hypothetical protein
MAVVGSREAKWCLRLWVLKLARQFKALITLNFAQWLRQPQLSRQIIHDTRVNLSFFQVRRQAQHFTTLLTLITYTIPDLEQKASANEMNLAYCYTPKHCSGNQFEPRH